MMLVQRKKNPAQKLSASSYFISFYILCSAFATCSSCCEMIENDLAQDLLLGLLVEDEDQNK